ncbi:MAG: YbaB/EbfC family nucleoid-associated protein [Gemmatimonadales bacterium]
MADPTRTPHPQNRIDADRRADAESRRIVGATAGGGMVRVTVDGHRTVRSLEIAPEAFEGRDAELLADMIMAAITEAQRRLDDTG